VWTLFNVDKDNLRKELLDKLLLLSNDDIHSLSSSLTNQIIKLLHMYPILQGQVGAGYLPLKAEIAPVYQELFRAIPLNLAYPVLVDGEMRFGLPQGLPKGSTWLDPPYHLVEPSWLFVPGVGFDLNGARLGRGKGFYDRYLEEHMVMTIGLAWSEQVKEKIPMESHDSHMDFIITEKFCWNVEQQKKF
jgi:5-formyltetrahydrofolate cyclo-ligase